MEEHKQIAIEAGKDFWELRIGINTGEVIAGVIGIKRFAYDVWGDAVNVANRMEMSGVPGKVNISGETHKHIEPFFNCTYRGKVAAKNKGEVDMYFVDGIKEEFTIDGNGIDPNSKFRAYIILHLYSTINYRTAERYILKVLEENLKTNLYYHDISHTLDVCETVEKIALHEDVHGEELFVLKTAALYHDAGFIKQYNNNEVFGVEMAEEALPHFGYTKEQVGEVSKLILATEVPHKPNGPLEEIICDADLDYLGRDDFHSIADKLRQELMERDIIKTYRDWDNLQVKFLSMHKYFTDFGIKKRKPKKLKHLSEIKSRLKEGNYPDKS